MVAENLTKVFAWVDSLAVVDDKTPLNDIVLHTMMGLGNENVAFVKNARETKVSFVQLQSMLSSLEICNELVVGPIMTMNTIINLMKEKWERNLISPKRHKGLICYNTLNTTKCMSTNKRELLNITHP